MRRGLRRRDVEPTELCADLGAAADRARAALLLHDGLRVLDAAAFADDTHLMVLLPELRPSEVPAAAARVLGALRPLYHNSAAPRAAWATCPGDGADLDTAGRRFDGGFRWGSRSRVTVA